MWYFEKYFESQGQLLHFNGRGFASVHCPFHDDKAKSATVNRDRNKFKCFACDIVLTEPEFMSRIEELPITEAYKQLEIMKEAPDADNNDAWASSRKALQRQPKVLQVIEELGLSSMIDVLQLGYTSMSGEISFSFPIFYKGKLVNVRTYRPKPQNGQPKVQGLKGHSVEYLYPYDLWVNDPRPTLLCAGEKDMAIARAKGFNSLTFLGGEQMLPKIGVNAFKGKTVYIVYDNDEAGKQGAKKVAVWLKELGAKVYNVTGHHEVCKEDKEDIHDFFMKYKRTASDLQMILDRTPEFTEVEAKKEKSKQYPIVNLEEATQGRYRGRLISSRIVVVEDHNIAFQVPEVAVISTDEGDKYWALSDDITNVVKLCDNNIKEKDVYDALKSFVGIIEPKERKAAKVHIKSYTNVFKYTVADDKEVEVIDPDAKDYKSMELIMYSLKNRLYSGQKLRAYFRTTTNANKNMSVVGVIDRVEESDNSITSFVVTPSVKESLRCFQGHPREKMKEAYERAKAIIHPAVKKEMFYPTELFFHTPMYYDFGKQENLPATLDILVVGDERTLKSETPTKLLKYYQQGVFISCKSFTPNAIVGGQDMKSGKIRLGALARNHKGAVILEEFSEQSKDLMRRLTDIRSSGKVRMGRVSGESYVDCRVRMLWISNPKRVNGKNLPIRAYANGIDIIETLIGNSEDIARFDAISLVCEDSIDGYISANAELELEPYSPESYRNRIKWVWSRKKEQIILSREIQDYIEECARDLNRHYHCRLKLFGPEAPKKLAKVAIAVAGCCVSTDENFENLIVKPEHVAWAKGFLKRCYDNPAFRIREYVEYERQYTECNGNIVTALQHLYDKYPPFIKKIATERNLSFNLLRRTSDMTDEEYQRVMNEIYNLCFVETGQNGQLYPSLRFRKAYDRIQKKDPKLKRVEERF